MEILFGDEDDDATVEILRHISVTSLQESQRTYVSSQPKLDNESVN